MQLLNYEFLLPAFALVLARVSGLMLAVPIFASTQTPRMFKVWLTVALSMVLFPAVSKYLPTSLTLTEAAVGMAGEFVLGEIIGLGVGLVFFAAQFAGQLVAHQSGLSLGATFNPIFDAETTVLDQLWFFLVMVFFLGLRGDLAVIHALLGSFKQVPPMQVIAQAPTLDFLTGVLSSIFDLALRLSGPVILALLLALLAMGVLTKTMPQFNILTVGFTLKIVVALFLTAVTMQAADGMIADGLFQGLDRVGLLLQDMANGVTRAG